LSEPSKVGIAIDARERTKIIYTTLVSLTILKKVFMKPRAQRDLRENIQKIDSTNERATIVN
jgi:hypothetical protein